MKINKIMIMVLILIGIFFININSYASDNQEEKCFNTDGADSIELIIENNSIESNRDLELYIMTNKSIKGREIQLNDNGTVRKNENEVAVKENDGKYWYKYTYLTYKDSKINNIILTNLPNENITFYAYIKYYGKEYHVTNAKNKTNNQDLVQSQDTSLVPKVKFTQEEIKKLQEEDSKIMKQKWADALKIDVADVDKYVDLYNAKGQGKLHKEGKFVKNEKNEIVNINGVGLFHLLDYGYMYNEDTIKALKYWGINCIRIPAYLNYRISSVNTTITPSERGLATAFDEYMDEMDRIIDIATKEGLYCMVDFHILETDGDISQYTEMAEKFFTHFGSKYGKQDNILWELANEPYKTSKENLATYLKTIREIVKKYDSNPVMITGWTAHDTSIDNDFTQFYNYFKTQGLDDMFVSYHYYGGDKIEWIRAFYESTEIPLSYSEWSNYDSDLEPDNGKNYTELTKEYMKWWNENGIINCAWMLCHGNWKYILWNKDLGDKSEALKYGCISDEYISDYGKLVFQTCLNNTIEKVKNNEVYINRDNNKNDDFVTPEPGIDGTENDDTVAPDVLPKAGKSFMIVWLIIIFIVIGKVVYSRYKNIKNR